jgi:hypothetical protein
MIRTCVICGLGFMSIRGAKTCSRGCWLAREAARSRKYRAEHPEQVAACDRKYRSEHREQRAASSRKYRAEHPEKFAAYHRKYHAEHREQYRAHNRKYRAEHPEQVRGKNERYRERKTIAVNAARELGLMPPGVSIEIGYTILRDFGFIKPGLFSLNSEETGNAIV